MALDRWADWHHVKLSFIQPGKTEQNGFIESFNGKSLGQRTPTEFINEYENRMT